MATIDRHGVSVTPTSSPEPPGMCRSVTALNQFMFFRLARSEPTSGYRPMANHNEDDQGTTRCEIGFGTDRHCVEMLRSNFYPHSRNPLGP